MTNTHIKPPKKQVALSKRILSPYECNHLLRHGISLELATTTESPVEYLSGWVDFCDLQLKVSPATLIPRIETEELVSLVLIDIEKNHSRAKHIAILDVGTGSGAIAIAVSHALTKLQQLHTITAIDISQEALVIARQNKELFADELLPIEFVQSNLLEYCTAGQEKIPQVDYIIANLPYIPSERIPTLDASVVDFEPHLALDGGPAGLDLVARLLEQAKEVLKPNGKVFMELDHTHTTQNIAALLETNTFTVSCMPSTLGGAIFCIVAKQQK